MYNQTLTTNLQVVIVVQSVCSNSEVCINSESLHDFETYYAIRDELLLFVVVSGAVSVRPPAVCSLLWNFHSQLLPCCGAPNLSKIAPSQR